MAKITYIMTYAKAYPGLAVAGGVIDECLSNPRNCGVLG